MCPVQPPRQQVQHRLQLHVQNIDLEAQPTANASTPPLSPLKAARAEPAATEQQLKREVAALQRQRDNLQWQMRVARETGTTTF